MNSRERLLTTLNHKEPDYIPYDLAGSTWTGITWGSYKNLVKYLGLPEEKPVWADTVQQIVFPSQAVLDRLEVDTRGLTPLTSHNWDVFEKCVDKGDHYEYFDEWQFRWNFLKDGFWFGLVESPMEGIMEPTQQDVIDFKWPYAADKRRIEGLREKALRFRDEGKLVIVKGLCAGIFEMHQRVRGMTNALMEPILYPEFSDLIIGKIADLKIEFWEMCLDALGDVVDVVAEGDDYGTQDSQLISPDQFREYYKPHIARVMAAIKRKAPNAKTMFHSCGNVRPIIPDFIECGIDILNPVHVTAKGMEPVQLKKDFGNDIVFWGAGVETQTILPLGTPQQVADDVKRNIDILAPGGGYVFTTVHNIQAEVSPENLMAMWNTYKENRNY